MRFALIWILCMVVFILTFAGCMNRTPAVTAAINKDNEAVTVYAKNASNQYDGLEAAAIAGHTLRMDVELQQDLKSLAAQAKLNPVQWDNVSIAAETTRLQALHDKKIADYAASLAAYRQLKSKNEQVNLGAHKQIVAALNPPNTVASTTTVDLTGQINAASGVSAPAPIVPTK